MTATKGNRPDAGGPRESTDAAAGGSPNPRRPHGNLHANLDRLVRQFVGPKWASGQELWDWQLALLQLQREIQAAIKADKTSSKGAALRAASLAELRELRWQARRLGDAFAWIVLDLNPVILWSLGDNNRVPIHQDNHGSRGVVAIAQQLANSGWGFPLLHDVTDVLRIGDITFAKPPEHGSGASTLRTVEVKTRVEAEEPISDTTKQVTYTVTVRYVPDRPNSDSGAADPPPIDVEVAVVSGSATSALRVDARHLRQFDRMAKAAMRQGAPDGEIIGAEGDWHLTKKVTSKASHNWKALRRVIRESRGTGYASEVVEGAHLYVALFSSVGLDAQTTRACQV